MLDLNEAREKLVDEMELHMEWADKCFEVLVNGGEKGFMESVKSDMKIIQNMEGPVKSPYESVNGEIIKEISVLHLICAGFVVQDLLLEFLGIDADSYITYNEEYAAPLITECWNSVWNILLCQKRVRMKSEVTESKTIH